MILFDREIKKLCEEEGMIVPFVSEKVRLYHKEPVVSYGLDSFGYDIRLSGRDFKLICGWNPAEPLDIKNIVGDDYQNLEHDENFVVLPPHNCMLAVSLEKFTIPFDVIGVCMGKSTYARAGILVNVTPLEPGWQGFLTLEIANLSYRPIKLYINEGIAKIMFYRGDQPSSSYGFGKYQNQQSNIQLPRM